MTHEPADPLRSAELHHQLATALLESVDDPSSTTIHLFYGQVATQSIAATTVQRADGTHEARRTPDAVIDVMESLRTAEAAPGRGAWISTTVTLQDGRLHADVKWDRRIFQNPADPYVPGIEPWMHFPDDDDWRMEFRVHPRSAEAVPDWARALVPDAEDDERARVSAEPVRAALLAAKGTLEIQRELASAMAHGVDRASTATIRLFYGRVGTQIIAATVVERPDGSLEHRRTSGDVIELMEELRASDASSESGAWISMFVTLQNGTFGADVNWDRRIYQNPADPFAPGDEAWMRVPDDDDWRMEFRVHPRSADAVPGWAVDLVPTAADDEVTREAAERLRAALIAAKGTFPESLAALKSAWGWPDIWEGVQEHLDGALSVARTSVLSRLSSDRAPERESAITSLAQDTWDRAYMEFFDERENQFLLDVFEALALVRPQAASIDTTRVDPKATFALKGNEDVFRVFDVVDSVLGEMIDAELDQRLAQV